MNTSQFREMDALFHPRSVAIIGASPVGDIATSAHINTKIKDHLYFVNPKYNELLGKRCYKSILDIDVPVDYVILEVSAELVLTVISECIQKGVKTAHIYTAGFTETGLPRGIELERKLKELAAGKIRIIGPNCFGVYCPSSGLAIIPESSEETGGVGVIAQSGSVAESFSFLGKPKNILFSKVISYGNAMDLDCPEILEYMADDPETKVIALYIEGAKDGKKLKKALKYATDRKPVVAIKGGLTDNGNRVARSHTGQLTGAPEIWRSLFQQCGVIQVNNNEELMNATIAFSHSPLPRGNRVAMMTNSGGFSVIQTDLCAAEGLDAHGFSESTLQKIRELVPLAGTSISNPLDAYPIFYKVNKDEPNVETAIKAIARDKNIDSLVIMFDQYRFLRRILGDHVDEHVGKMTSLMVEGSKYCRDVMGKPVLLNVSIDPFFEDEVDRKGNLKLKKCFEQADFPVFSTSNGAIKALAALYKYFAVKGVDLKK